MKPGHFFLSICLSAILVLFSTWQAKAQINADFSATVSSDPVTYPGYPSTGTLSIIVNTPNDPDIIPAATFAVIATAGGAVGFILEDFTPPSGWALDMVNSDPTNVVIYNSAPLSANVSHIPISIDVPTRAVTNGETTHMVDIVPIRDGWRDPEDGNHQPDVRVTVLEISLPVVLSSFEIWKEGANSLLSWTTTEELNSSHFEILHSVDASYWTEIGQVKSNGKDKSIQRYSHLHQSPAGGMNYYRLRMRDLDGSSELSEVKSIRFSSINRTELFPNPARDILSIHSKDWEHVTEVTLFNSSGMAAYRSEASPEKEVNIRHLPPGVYVLRVTMSDSSTNTHKVIIR